MSAADGPSLAASSIRRSLAFAFIDRYASLVIGIVSSMVIARLLRPDEVGTYSVAMALLTLLSTVRDMGAGQYLVREKRLTNDRIRAVWTVQLGIGCILGITVAAASVPVAHFYRQPMMQEILILLGIGYLVNPFGSITYAWLIREMRYDAVALMRFVATATTAIVSIWLACLGFGALSLAWGGLCGTLANALVAVFYRPRQYPWKPGLRHVRSVIAFGGQLTAVSLLRSLATSAPEFIIGRVQGLAAAGYLSRANGLVGMFDRLVNDAVSNVAMALFAREAREGADPKAKFLRALAYVTALSWPFAICLALLADPLVHVLYGGQWTHSVALVRWLAGGLAFASIIPLCNATMTGLSATRPLMVSSAVGCLLLLAGAAAAAPFGVQALVRLLMLAYALYAVVALHGVHRAIGASWGELWRALWPSLPLAACTATVPLGLVLHVDVVPVPPLVFLAAAGTGAIGGFLLGLRMTGHVVRSELVGALPPFARPLRRWLA